MAKHRVLSIGQCGADHAAIARSIERHFDAEVLTASTAEEARAKLQKETFALVLINRILDADGSSGIDVLKRFKAEEGMRDVPIMLVSNREDAQREAVQAGAVRGFGKAGLGQPQMLGRLQPFLQTAESVSR